MTTIAISLIAAISNVAELRQAVWSGACTGKDFSVTCTVSAVAAASGRHTSYWVVDGDDYAYLRATNGPAHAVGERIVASGHVGPDSFNWQRAFLENATSLGKGTVPDPVPATPEQLADESFDGKIVVMRGIVTDIVHDEIDPAWRFLLMRTETTPFFAAVSAGKDASLDHLLGDTVTARGVANVLPDGGKRKFQTPQLTVTDISDIKIVALAPEDPCDAPAIPDHPQQALENVRYKSVAALSRMGLRGVRGHVIAVFDDGLSLMVMTDSGQLFGADLRKRADIAYGEDVTVAGFPETDLFIIKLSKATFRRMEGKRIEPAEAMPLPSPFPMEKVLRDICARGQAISVRGTAGSHASLKPGVFSIVHGGQEIEVDYSAVADKAGPIAPGSKVEVSGICVRNTTTVGKRNGFPRTEGFTLVPRTAADVKVVSGPPWWTVGRMLSVVLALFTILLAVLAWNRFLRKIVDRRGRELYRKELEKTAAELRVDERTRLAVELHDSIAQTLTGVSFQIDAAEKTMPTEIESSAHFLGVAKKTLLSCREELRRCLWDLRSETLTEPDLQQAIEKTLKPHTVGAEVSVRFHASRSKIPETTAHNVLSMIRELCVNAIKHGGASRIRVVGELRDEVLRFSVRDNGCGFDTAARPGPQQGHFGLQGIKERTSRLHGKFTLESAPGKGTNATVEIPL